MVLLERLRSFLKSKSASVLPITALIMVPVLITVGVAVDYSRLAKNRGKMINAADAAVLAAAEEARKLPDLKDVAAVKAKLRKDIDLFLQANMGDVLAERKYDIKYNPDEQFVDLKVEFSFDTSFLKVAGLDELEATVETAVFIEQDQQQTLSMYLVLDRSGSMIWGKNPTYRYNAWGQRYPVPGPGPEESRMTSLKKAVRALHNEFEKSDPDHKFVRTGASAYERKVVARTQMEWGSLHVSNMTNSLNPNGGTNASTALADAYSALKGDKEEQEHAKNGNVAPLKYILLMTDGENNYDSDDVDSRRFCRDAKKENVIIYSVAFHAPKRGQELLKYCATSDDHYFVTEESSELIDAFRSIGEQAGRELAIAK